MSIESELFSSLAEGYENDDEARIAAGVHVLEDFISQDVDNDELETLLKSDLANEELERLDELCSYTDSFVSVSGPVFCGYYDEFEAKSATEKRVLDNGMLFSKGFAIASCEDETGIVRDQVGHLFLIPRANYSYTAAPLSESTVQYYAFAPYGTIAIEAERSPKQRIEYLQHMIPDMVDQVDQLVSDAPSSIDAVMRLRRMSVKVDQVPSEVLQELVAYTNDMIALDANDIYDMKLQGMYSVDINEDMTLYLVHDASDYRGGKSRVLARCGRLFLAAYQANIGGEIFTSNELYWSIELSVIADDKNGETERSMDVSTIDITDAISLRAHMIDQWTSNS